MEDLMINKKKQCTVSCPRSLWARCVIFFDDRSDRAAWSMTVLLCFVLSVCLLNDSAGICLKALEEQCELKKNTARISMWKAAVVVVLKIIMESTMKQLHIQKINTVLFKYLFWIQHFAQFFCILFFYFCFPFSGVLMCFLSLADISLDIY